MQTRPAVRLRGVAQRVCLANAPGVMYSASSLAYLKVSNWIYSPTSNLIKKEMIRVKS